MRRLPPSRFLFRRGLRPQVDAPPRRKRSIASRRRPAASRGAPAADADAAKDDAAGATRDVLRHYYALIEAGRYDDAWAMRTSGRGTDAAALRRPFQGL